MTTRRPAKGKDQAHGSGQRGKAAASRMLPLLELRSYVLANGQRDALNTMFEEHFLDAYEAAGARILGVFFDADNPDRWIWIRAFSDPVARASALQGFYTSDAWLSLRGPANRTIRSSSDAILLSPLFGSIDGLEAPPGTRARSPQSVFECARCFLKNSESQEESASFMEQEVLPVLQKLGATPVGVMINSDAPNLYPRSRLRKGGVVVWFLRFASSSAYERHLAARKTSDAWGDAERELARRIKKPAEYIKLLPQRRSALR